MADPTRSGPTFVLDSRGGARSPFLRGVLTHHLMQRGMDFDDAYALASALKSRIADREEVSTGELRDLVAEQLEIRFGSSHPFTEGVPGLSVSYGGDAQPFSKGLLAQSLFATGLDTHRAYERVLEIESALRGEGVLRIDNAELAGRVEDHLRRFEGEAVARRYHLLRAVRGLPRPLVVYVGGVSGTGKSTVALEVAPMLRIYRINSTDTIRQVMRMMFSKAMLPALHRSTFEPEPDHDHSVQAGLEEQATRVCVGVRAVVERAIAENLSIFVEGVHLFPPHVPFPDLDGAAYQLYVLMTTLDEEVHRSHLLSRAQHSARPAIRYLDHLETIRSHQHLLIERATAAGHPIVDTSDRESSSRETARVIIDHLEERLPRTAPSLDSPAKTLLLLIDGLPDRPLRSLGGRTPLEAAHTPTLDRLAREGASGLADPVGPGIVPDTAAGTLAAFGVSPHSMKRGPIEAMGVGLELADRDIAWRGNLASLDANGLIMDRRAGRIRADAKELAAAVDGMVLDDLDGGPVEVLARAATEHRLAIVFRGDDLSSQLTGTDPGDAAPKGPALVPQPHPAHPEAKRTAAALKRFTVEAHRVLDVHPVNARRREAGLPPANGILTRGPGRFHPVKPHEIAGRPLRIACVAGDLTVLGVARVLGGHAVSSDAFTANLDTRLDRKFADAARLLDSRDLVVVHVKGADIASHDLRVDEKVRFLERLDRELETFFEQPAVQALTRNNRLRVLVAADHATYSESGQHGPDPVPVLIHGAGTARDDVVEFNERAVATGMLGRFPLQQFLPRILGRVLRPEAH